MRDLFDANCARKCGDSGAGSARGSKGLETMLDAARRLIAPSARSDVPAFMVMDVMAAAARIEAAGGRVIHMEVGQPAAPAPATAIAAARTALASGRLRYTETLGLPTLRARIARHYHDTYGVAVDPARVVVTTGSSGGFILAFLALFEPGDRVAVALPGYPPYRHILSALGCEPVAIETTQATRCAISSRPPTARASASSRMRSITASTMRLRPRPSPGCRTMR